MYENIVFDLYGTLVDIKTNENKAALWKKVALMYGYSGAFYTPNELRKAYKTLIAGKTKEMISEKSSVTCPEIELREVFSDFFTAKDVHPSKEMVEEIAHTFRVISTEYIRLFEGTKEMLTALKASGKRVYLLSNAQSCFTEPELTFLGIRNFFDETFLSSDCGCKKPDLSFYKKILDQKDLDPKKTIMVGNEYICDILGASKAGFDTLYMVSPQTPKNDPYVKSTYKLDTVDMKRMQEILLQEY